MPNSSERTGSVLLVTNIFIWSGIRDSQMGEWGDEGQETIQSPLLKIQQIYSHSQTPLSWSTLFAKRGNCYRTVIREPLDE